MNGIATAGSSVVLLDRLAGTTDDVFVGRTTADAYGNWYIDTGLDPIAVGGAHTLTAKLAFPSSSDSVNIAIGTSAAEIIQGPTLAGIYSGDMTVFAGSGDDRIVGYSVIRDFFGNHSSGGTTRADGGAGTDTLYVPSPISSVGLTRYGDAFTLSTPFHKVQATNIETLDLNGLRITVQHDPLVDFLFYDRSHADIAAADLNARVHYDAAGWREGRDPNAFFSTSAYLAVNRDVGAAGLNPLAHFDASGWREGRDPSVKFDTSLYLHFNPDVASAGVDPLLHYLNFGSFEHRKISPVISEGMVSGGFDSRFYLLTNADVAISGLSARDHYNTSGWKEGRDPNAYFDTSYYLATYQDVATAGMNPLQHYMENGWREGRDPSGFAAGPTSNFDPSAYFASNRDLDSTIVNPLDHFLNYGVLEGRSPTGDLF